MREGVRNNRIDTVRPEHTPEAMGRPPRVDDHGGEVYVYRRANLPCHLCGGEIRTAGLAARNLFWCPACQRRPTDRLRSGAGPGLGSEPVRQPGRHVAPNATDASASAPCRSSRTRPAPASEVSDTPPRYAAPNSRTDSARSAASAVRSQDAPLRSPVSRQRPAFHGQKASSTSNTTSTGVWYVRASSAAPSPPAARTATSRTRTSHRRMSETRCSSGRPPGRLRADDLHGQVDVEQEAPQRGVRRRVQRLDVPQHDRARSGPRGSQSGLMRKRDVPDDLARPARRPRTAAATPPSRSPGGSSSGSRSQPGLAGEHARPSGTSRGVHRLALLAATRSGVREPQPHVVGALRDGSRTRAVSISA